MTLKLGNQFTDETYDTGILGGGDYCGVIQDTLSEDATLKGVAFKSPYTATDDFGVVLYDNDTNALLASGEITSLSVLDNQEMRIDFDTPHEGVAGKTYLFGIYKAGGGPFGLRALDTGDQREEGSEVASQPIDPWSEDVATNIGDTLYLYVYADAAGPSPGLRHTLKDTDDGTVQANLTGLQVMAFKSVPANPIYQATNGTTDASGVFELNEPSINLNSIAGESLGTTDASGNLSATLEATSETLYDSIEASSVSITVSTETITDDGAGVLTGTATATGTVDYATGAISITGAAVSTAATGDYSWRQSEIFLTVVDGAGHNVAAAWSSVVDLNSAGDSTIRTGV